MPDVFGMIFTGVCNGLGTATGSYLATKYAIRHIEKLDERVKKKAEERKEGQA